MLIIGLVLFFFSWSLESFWGVWSFSLCSKRQLLSNSSRCSYLYFNLKLPLKTNQIWKPRLLLSSCKFHWIFIEIGRMGQNPPKNLNRWDGITCQTASNTFWQNLQSEGISRTMAYGSIYSGIRLLNCKAIYIEINDI